MPRHECVSDFCDSCQDYHCLQCKCPTAARAQRKRRRGEPHECVSDLCPTCNDYHCLACGCLVEQTPWRRPTRRSAANTGKGHRSKSRSRAGSSLRRDLAANYNESFSKSDLIAGAKLLAEIVTTLGAGVALYGLLTTTLPQVGIVLAPAMVGQVMVRAAAAYQEMGPQEKKATRAVLNRLSGILDLDSVFDLFDIGDDD